MQTSDNPIAYVAELRRPAGARGIHAEEETGHPGPGWSDWCTAKVTEKGGQEGQVAGK